VTFYNGLGSNQTNKNHFTNQTFTRLTLIYPLFATFECDMWQFLVATRLIRITLGTTQVTAVATSPQRAITLGLHTTDHPF
jgi:hypothetical protein